MEPNRTNAPVSPVEPVVPVEPSAPAEPAAPAASDGEKKTSKGMVAGMIILAIVAVAGIAFGVYELMQGSEKDSEIADLKTQVTNCVNAGNAETENETVTCPDGTATEIVKNVVTNDLAQSFIHPFIGAFTYLRNIFDHDFNDTTKFVLAFRNVNSETARGSDEGGVVIPYYAVNSEYKYLFGTDEDIEKKDYVGLCGTFTYYGDGNGVLSDSFEYKVAGCGGTGQAMFDIVKEAKYVDDGMIIDVYHNVVPICYPDVSDKYCMDINANSAIINSIDQYNMREYIEKFNNEIPVYRMTFVKDNGRYVLTNIRKQ